MENINYNELLKRVLDIGEKMIMVGAEVGRVEDSMKRMFSAYGIEKTEIFIITSSMVVTIETPEGETFTQSRSIKGFAIDLEKVDLLNSLSRHICMDKPSTDEIKRMFDEISNKKPFSLPIRMLFGGGTAACFAVFFGGGVIDAILSGSIGVIVILLDFLFKKVGSHEIIFCFLITTIAGILTVISTRLISGTHVDMVTTGIIMILIPGLVMTNAVRDMILGDTISGLLRLIQSLLITTALAVGFGLAIYLFGGVA